MYERILVATDGSTLSKKAVTTALGLAKLCGAEVVALKVVARYPMSYFEGGMAIQASEVERVEKQWAEGGQAVVDAVKKAGLAKGVRSERATVIDGPFAETKEMLAGFNLIEAESMEAAVRMAQEFPWTRYGCIEVRPLRDVAAVRARVGA